MEKVLIDTEEFNGRYVALKSFADKTVVGVGDDPEKALKMRHRKATKTPCSCTCRKRMPCTFTLLLILIGIDTEYART